MADDLTATLQDAQCEHYGSFMHDLSRPAAEAMYWIFFVTVLGTLFSASWRYGRVMERIEGMRVGDWERQHLIYKCFYITLFSGVISLCIAILEAFVLLTLQFCDGEPLASLYWSTWTVLQVGAVVAIFGITLHVRHMIKGRRHPPWALALGTPVLVVAGLGHYFQGKLKKKAHDIKERSRSRSRDPRGRSRGEPLSEVPTVRGQSTDSGDRTPAIEEDAPTVYDGILSDKFNARIIGFTKEGDVILRVSPELSEELNQTLKTPSSITWNEPHRKMSTQVATDEIRTSEPGTPRIGRPTHRSSSSVGRPTHRSSSSVTVKGKEKELFTTTKLIEDADQDDNTSVSNDTPADIREFKRDDEQKEYAFPWRSDVEKNLDGSIPRTSSSRTRAEAGKPEESYPGGDEKA